MGMQLRLDILTYLRQLSSVREIFGLQQLTIADKFCVSYFAILWYFVEVDKIHSSLCFCSVFLSLC